MSMDLSFLDLDTLEKLEKLQPAPPELAILKAFTAEDVSVLDGVSCEPAASGKSEQAQESALRGRARAKARARAQSGERK